MPRRDRRVDVVLKASGDSVDVPDISPLIDAASPVLPSVTLVGGVESMACSGKGLSRAAFPSATIIFESVDADDADEARVRLVRFAIVTVWQEES